jgi:hypothetical protein
MKSKLFAFFLILFISIEFNAQTNNYNGELDEKKIKGTLTFKKDDTVTGSYYYVTSPDRVYKISGTNFVNGEIEVNVYFAGKIVSSGSLSKTLTDSYVIWEGALWLDDSNRESRYFIFRRPRYRRPNETASLA